MKRKAVSMAVQQVDAAVHKGVERPQLHILEPHQHLMRCPGNLGTDALANVREHLVDARQALGRLLAFYGQGSGSFAMSSSLAA